MPSILEVSANTVNALSIVLAARNSVHTWWTGIVGCSLFALLFYRSQLYADALLQVFFIVTSLYGWRQWQFGGGGRGVPVTHVPKMVLSQYVGVAVVLAGGYGVLLRHYTDAFAPFADSLVLSLSILAQLLLMQRRYETWWVWLLVNLMSVALFGIRGLWVTMALYSAFLVNTLVALRSWRRLVRAP